MTVFGWFFRAAIFNLTVSLLPTLPACEKSTKISKKYFHNSKKIDAKIKIKKLKNQALAAYPKYVRTHL